MGLHVWQTLGGILSRIEYKSSCRDRPEPEVENLKREFHTKIIRDRIRS